MEATRKQPGNSLEATWKLSGMSLEAARKLSGSYLEAQPGRSLKATYKLPGSRLEEAWSQRNAERNAARAERAGQSTPRLASLRVCRPISGIRYIITKVTSHAERDPLRGKARRPGRCDVGH